MSESVAKPLSYQDRCANVWSFAVVGPQQEGPALSSLAGAAPGRKAQCFPHAAETPSGVRHATCRR